MIAGNLNSSSWCGNKEVADHASILPSIFHDGKHPQNRTKREEATDAVIPYAAESKIISRTLSQVLYSFELLLTYASLIKLMYANKEWNLQRKKDIFLSVKNIKVKCYYFFPSILPRSKINGYRILMASVLKYKEGGVICYQMPFSCILPGHDAKVCVKYPLSHTSEIEKKWIPHSWTVQLTFCEMERCGRERALCQLTFIR